MNGKLRTYRLKLIHRQEDGRGQMLEQLEDEVGLALGALQHNIDGLVDHLMVEMRHAQLLQAAVHLVAVLGAEILVEDSVNVVDQRANGPAIARYKKRGEWVEFVCFPPCKLN